jgi:hypothetical protein
MASSIQRNHAFIYDRKCSKNAHYNRSYIDYNDSHAMFASRRVCDKPSTIYHACNTSFALVCKNEKVVARKLGSKCKGDKACVWVPKAIVTNLVGPNKSWVPKTQA